MKRELTCIVCPMGCHLEVGIEDGKIEYIKGNTCGRGAVYAEEECTNPTRVLTTTALCSDGSVLPVKTSAPIPKGMLFDVMKIVNNCEIPLPISIGDVIIKDVMGTGADIIATQNKK